MADPTTITFDSKSHIVLPFLPDWTSAVEGDRERFTGVSKSKSGNEDRASFRPKSLIRLSNLIAPADEAGRIDMVDSLLALKRSRLVAMPFWGWAVKISEIAADLLTVQNNDFGWVAGMYVFLSNNNWRNHQWEMIQLNTVYDGFLELASSPVYSSHRFAWPVLFGEFDCGDIGILNNRNAEIEVEVKQLIPFDDATIPAAYP